MKNFVKSNYIEFFLCLIASITFVINVFAGFFVYDAPIIITILLCFCLELIYYACSYSKKSIIIGIIAIVITVIALILSMRFSLFSSEMTAYLVVIFISTLLVFLMSRNRMVSLVWLPISFIALFFVAFLDYKTSTVAYIIYIFIYITLHLFKTYKYNIIHSFTEKPSFTGSLISSSLISLVATGLSCLIFFVIIAPLTPPTQDAKLFTELRKLEVLKRMGVSTVMHLDNDDLKSKNTNNNSKTSNNPSVKKSDTADKDKKDDKSEDENDKKTKDDSLANSKLTEFFQGVSYLNKLPSPWLLLLLIPIALIIAIALKQGSRKRFIKRLKNKDAKDQIYYLYTFFTKKFSIIKIKKPVDMTPNEYAGISVLTFENFSTPDCTYKDIAEIFTNTFYGDLPPSEEELNKYYSFYDGFYKNIRYHLGKAKYILKFFIL